MGSTDLPRRITNRVTKQRNSLPCLNPVNRYGLKTIGDFGVTDVLGDRESTCSGHHSWYGPAEESPQEL